MLRPKESCCLVFLAVSTCSCEMTMWFIIVSLTRRSSNQVSSSRADNAVSASPSKEGQLEAPRMTKELGCSELKHRHQRSSVPLFRDHATVRQEDMVQDEVAECMALMLHVIVLHIIHVTLWPAKRIGKVIFKQQGRQARSAKAPHSGE